MKPNVEYIISAAIWFNDGKKHENPHCKPRNIFTGYVIAGLRHCNCLATYQVISNKRSPESGIPQTQGFITSNNRFVDRIEGNKIAINAEQVYGNEDGDQLFSEDLY
jgi:hypothetical protein